VYHFGRIRSPDEKRPQDDTLAAWAYRGLKANLSSLERKWRTTDYYRFEDRRENRDTLICVMAGRKPGLWPFTLPRLAEAVGNVDVCICSAGLRSEQLAIFCKAQGWSYLSIATTDPALAQNICYKLHQHADLILKVDEDCFLLEDSLTSLASRFRATEEEAHVRPGLLAPLVPIDAFAHRVVLDSAGLLRAYEDRFGKARFSESGCAVEQNIEAVQWIWQQTAPLESLARRLKRGHRKEPIMAPVRYDTALIAFRRTFWEDSGYLPVFRRRLMIGRNTFDTDRSFFCAHAMLRAQPVVIAPDLVVGRFSHEHQYSAMLPFLREHPEYFTP